MRAVGALMAAYRPRQPYSADERLTARCANLERELAAVQYYLGMDAPFAEANVHLWMERHIAVLVQREIRDRQREAFDAGAHAMRELILGIISHRFPEVKKLQITKLEGRP